MSTTARIGKAVLIGLAAGLVLALAFAFTGCGGGSHHGPRGKQYLGIEILEDNTVIATVTLPDDHDALLYFENGVVVLETVINSGEINLGVFLPGEYTLCVELRLIPDGEAVAEECCAFVIEDTEIEPPDGDELPPEPDDPNSRFAICHGGFTHAVPWNALEAHFAHGDTLGVCEFGNENEVEVEPVFRLSTDVPGERRSVIVFGRKPKKPKRPVVEECFDENLNQRFAEFGLILPSTPFPVEYHSIFEPVDAFSAIDRGFSAWEAILGEDTFDFVRPLLGESPPDRDGINVVGWRVFTGPGSNFLAAAFIWDDGVNIVECDIFYNLKNKWGVNAIIEPGSILCGRHFDVQGVGTHEVGHMLGLDHVPNSDATMAPAIAKGELEKQTLTPGDELGALDRAP